MMNSIKLLFCFEFFKCRSESEHILVINSIKRLSPPLLGYKWKIQEKYSKRTASKLEIDDPKEIICSKNFSKLFLGDRKISTKIFCKYDSSFSRSSIN